MATQDHPIIPATIEIDERVAELAHDAHVEAEQILCDVIDRLTISQPTGWRVMRGMLIRARQLNGIAGAPYCSTLPASDDGGAAAVADLAWDVTGAMPG